MGEGEREREEGEKVTSAVCLAVAAGWRVFLGRGMTLDGEQRWQGRRSLHNLCLRRIGAVGVLSLVGRFRSSITTNQTLRLALMEPGELISDWPPALWNDGLIGGKLLVSAALRAWLVLHLSVGETTLIGAVSDCPFSFRESSEIIDGVEMSSNVQTYHQLSTTIVAIESLS